MAILFVGRFVERKGIFDLVDAFESVQAEAETDVELYLVGSRGEEQAVQDAVRDQGVAENAHLLGNIPIEELPGYYAAADIACHPSHWESFAMVNLEAMACGTPVVTSRLDAVEDYLTDGETALLVPPGDPDALANSLTRLADDIGLRQRLGHAGHEVARSYSWEHQARSLEEALQKLLPQPDIRTRKQHPVSARTKS